MRQALVPSHPRMKDPVRNPSLRYIEDLIICPVSYIDFGVRPSLSLWPGAARCGPVHNFDRHSNLTGLTFTALTPPATLFDVVLAVLTPLGRDFLAHVAPAWAPGPTPEKL